MLAFSGLGCSEDSHDTPSPLIVPVITDIGGHFTHMPGGRKNCVHTWHYASNRVPNPILVLSSVPLCKRQPAIIQKTSIGVGIRTSEPMQWES